MGGCERVGGRGAAKTEGKLVKCASASLGAGRGLTHESGHSCSFDFSPAAAASDSRARRMHLQRAQIQVERWREGGKQPSCGLQRAG